MNCIAFTKKGDPCSREVVGDGNGYGDQTLDFGNYCGVHIWGHFKVGAHIPEIAQVAAFWKAPEPIMRIQRTAAHEALSICRKFFPWRVQSCK